MPAARRAYTAWIVVSLVWGTTYLAIRIGLETIPPFLLAALRWSVAGTIILAMLKLQGKRLPSRETWGALAVLGVLLLGFGNGGIVWAERTVPSGLTAVLAAMSPFWMVGIEAGLPDGESLTFRRVLGLTIGFAGIVAMIWPEIRFGEDSRGFAGGVIATQLACLGWAIGSAWARRHGNTFGAADSILAQAAFQMLFGGMALGIVGLLRHEWTDLMFTPRTFGALAYLTIFGAVIGFSAYAYALKTLPVAVVSLYAYVNPIIAMALGTILLREPFGSRTALAAGVVLTGMALVRENGRLVRPPVGR